jgi:RNA polymerase sigma-70 factor (ECF subfamily)
VAVHIVRDEGEAEDVVQTVFLNLFQAAANFDPLRGTLKVWLLQFAYHRSINRRRSLSTQGVYRWDELDADNERSQEPAAEAIRLCEQMLMRLKPIQRQVLELTYFEGCTAQEIAVRQGRQATNVRHDLYRGLAKLRAFLTAPVKNPVRECSATREREVQIADAPTI